MTVASSTLDLVKKLKNLDHDLDKASLKSDMVELYSNLAEVKMALVDAQQALHEKDRLLEEFKAQGDFKGTLVTIHGFKYYETDENPIGLPYCPTCETNHGKFFRLSRKDEQYSRCMDCNKSHNAGMDGRVNKKTPPISLEIPRLKRL